MQIITDYITLKSDGHCHIIDITDSVAGSIQDSQKLNGLVTVFVPGATGAITTIEYEPGLLRDFEEFLEKIIPQGKNYYHNMAWHDGNGHSHIRASLIGPSLTIPLVQGNMTLGTWQNIVFIDFDNRPRSRKLVIQIIGT